MKNLNWFLHFLIISTLFFSCNEETEQAPAFTFKALLNEADWQATSARAGFDDNNKSYFISATKVGLYYSEERRIGISIPEENIVTGREIRDFEAEYSFLIGGDGLARRLQKSMDTTQSFLLIQEIDSINQRISGTFEIQFEDDDYKFTSGEFDLDFDEF